MSGASDPRPRVRLGIKRRAGQLLRGDSQTSAEVGLVYARDDLVRGTWQPLILAALMTILVIALFDWDIGEMWLPGLVGAALWGSVFFFSAVRMRLPSGRVPDVPDGSDVSGSQRRDGWLSRLGLVLFMTTACVGLAWLADRWDASAVFVPGQFLGYAGASALGALLVARWERSTGRRVVFDLSEDEDDLSVYATRRPGGASG